MRIEIASFTQRGAELAAKLAEQLRAQGEDARAWGNAKYAAQNGLPPMRSASDWTNQTFPAADALIFVGATGIAVRSVAPLLRSKLTDPAVISVDEAGRFVVALVSGHVGGANRLAHQIAALTGGQAVVSTATDVNGRFAVDEWIIRNDMALVNPHAVRTFASALLDGKVVGLSSEFPAKGPLPEGVVWAQSGAVGLHIDVHRASPFGETVCAVPRIVTLGIGCRRDTPWEAIEEAVALALEQENMHPEALCGAASIDLKRDEAGLLAFCERRKLPIHFYSAEELAAVPGEFTASERVLRVTGVDNVCERAAVLAGGRLLSRKFAHNGVTVALAISDFHLNFEGECI